MDTIPTETIPGAQDVSPPEGDVTDPNDVTSVKEVLSEVLGKEFKSDEDALKAVKDTQDYVGKIGKFQPLIDQLETKSGGEQGALDSLTKLLSSEAPATPAAPDTSGLMTKADFEQTRFYDKNPELAPMSDMLNAMAKTTGKPLKDVVELETIKPLIEAKKLSDSQDESKSVLMQNPRLGKVKDKLAEAGKAMTEARKSDDPLTARKHMAAAKSQAVGAVLDSIETA